MIANLIRSNLELLKSVERYSDPVKIRERKEEESLAREVSLVQANQAQARMKHKLEYIRSQKANFRSLDQSVRTSHNVAKLEQRKLFRNAVQANLQGNRGDPGYETQPTANKDSTNVENSRKSVWGTVATSNPIGLGGKQYPVHGEDLSSDHDKYGSSPSSTSGSPDRGRLEDGVVDLRINDELVNDHIKAIRTRKLARGRQKKSQIYDMGSSHRTSKDHSQDSERGSGQHSGSPRQNQ